MDHDPLRSEREEQQTSQPPLPADPLSRVASTVRQEARSGEVTTKSRRLNGRQVHLLLMLLVTIGSLALFVQSDRSGAYFTDRDPVEGNRITMGESFPTREAEEAATTTPTPTQTPSPTPKRSSADALPDATTPAPEATPTSTPAPTDVPPTETPQPTEPATEPPPASDTPAATPSEPTPEPGDDQGEPTVEPTVEPTEPEDGEDGADGESGEDGEDTNSQMSGIQINIIP